MTNDKKSDSRYPYTYACDLIRTSIPYGENGCILSRSNASLIYQLFSKVLNIDEKELAKRLADYYITHKDDDNQNINNFIKNLNSK